MCVCVQPYIFGLTMSCWAVGSIAAPIVGGTLAEPCRTWPQLASSRHCAPEALLARFPFMLPCLVAAGLCALSLTVCAFALGRNEDVLAAWPLEDSVEEQPLFSDESKERSKDAAEIVALDEEEICDNGDDSVWFSTVSGRTSWQGMRLCIALNLDCDAHAGDRDLAACQK